jgi:predicted pyridoxine 5'-phosphate oxidase superfamily flavin-nucleotide-binding protein
MGENSLTFYSIYVRLRISIIFYERKRIMAKIPQEVKEFIPGKMGWVGTATADGVPNVTPKGTAQILDDEHLIFADLFSRKTRENLEKNPQVSITVIDEKSFKG